MLHPKNFNLNKSIIATSNPFRCYDSQVNLTDDCKVILVHDFWVTYQSVLLVGLTGFKPVLQQSKCRVLITTP